MAFSISCFFEYILLLFYQLISHGQAVRYKKRTWRQGQLTPWGWRHQPVELEARAKCKTLTQVGASTRCNYLEYPVRISFLCLLEAHKILHFHIALIIL